MTTENENNVKQTNADPSFEESLNLFGPEISCVTRIKQTACNVTGRAEFSFTICLTHGLCFELSFMSFPEAKTARGNLAKYLSEYFGHSNIVFSAGLKPDIVVLNAVEDITELQIKDDHTVFSLMFKCKPYSMHMIDNNIQRGKLSYQNIKKGMEGIKNQQHGFEFKHSAVG